MTTSSMIEHIVMVFKNMSDALGFKPSPDPVKDCPVYLDKIGGSCAHVDGPLCGFPDCYLIDKHNAKIKNQVPGPV